MKRNSIRCHVNIALHLLRKFPKVKVAINNLSRVRRTAGLFLLKVGIIRDCPLHKGLYVRHAVVVMTNMGLINKVDMVCLSPVGYGV